MTRDFASGDRSPVGISLEQVAKNYPGGVAALQALNLRIEPGERLVVLGPSGSGKSTLLRLIAGLEPLTAGRITIDGRDQAGVPSHRRDLSMVFQNPALFPHLSVFENLAFGLRARRPSAEVPAAVAETAAILGLSNLLDRRPENLSGGERQRVAIGRAIAWKPRVLLLDEPFASLDAPLRTVLREELIDLHRRFGMTMIHVTHDQGESLSIGDRIAVLDRGRIMQCDTPQRLYECPAHRFIAEFIGNPPMNVLPCEITRESDRLVVRLAEDLSIILLIADIPSDDSDIASLPVGYRCRLDMGIRPEHLAVHNLSASSEVPHWSTGGLVQRVEYQGHETWIHLELAGRTLRMRDFKGQCPREGERVPILPALVTVSWFDPESGLAVKPGGAPLPEGAEDDSFDLLTRDR